MMRGCTVHRIHTHTDSPIWKARATHLARWTLDRLANRVDRHGWYIPAGKRKKPDDKSRTGYQLSEDMLRRHFGGSTIRGLHSTSPDNLCKWCAWDIDQHTDVDTGLAAKNEAYAIHLFGELTRLGFRPLLTDSNGNGGYHILVIFAQPTPSEHVYRFAQWVTRDHDRWKVDAPETFPKQSRLTAQRKFGNWLRLPGRHHTRHHWSIAYDGQWWLDDRGTVERILATEPRGTIPDEALAWHTPQERDAERRAAEIAERKRQAGEREAYTGDTDSDTLLSALSAIDPDCSYDMWLAVGMALHSYDASMLDDWRRWSSGGAKYHDGDCEAKWATFSIGSGYTIGTVFRFAFDTGWRFPPRDIAAPSEPYESPHATVIGLDRWRDELAANYLTAAIWSKQK